LRGHFEAGKKDKRKEGKEGREEERKGRKGTGENTTLPLPRNKFLVTVLIT